jgi:hypothetical protein
MNSELLRSSARRNAIGIALFLFIPVVLFLFVAHPEPVVASLVGGILLMAGHRRLAFPYFRAIRPTTCAWCHRELGGARSAAPAVELAAGAETHELLACERHVEPTRRFFELLDRLRWPLRVGIGLPLLLLLVALAAAAAGQREGLEAATQGFRLAVGITVQIAALGPMIGVAKPAATAAFPVHNFYLLGIRAILWIFRLVGLWWIVSAGLFWLRF